MSTRSKCVRVSSRRGRVLRICFFLCVCWTINGRWRSFLGGVQQRVAVPIRSGRSSYPTNTLVALAEVRPVRSRAVWYDPVKVGYHTDEGHTCAHDQVREDRAGALSSLERPCCKASCGEQGGRLLQQECGQGCGSVTVEPRDSSRCGCLCRM